MIIYKELNDLLKSIYKELITWLELKKVKKRKPFFELDTAYISTWLCHLG
jgi:hypothetical protein